MKNRPAPIPSVLNPKAVHNREKIPDGAPRELSKRGLENTWRGEPNVDTTRGGRNVGVPRGGGDVGGGV